MIEYRSFRNADPPQLVRLWHECRLGRGAAAGFTVDALETLTFAQPYFDPAGLILACDETRVVGWVHAGFGSNADETALARESGVLCAVLVHPDYRRRGIGRELVARAERYLLDAGARTIHAGPAAPNDPFFVGLYGGSQPAGFLESDPDAAPFFEALGYRPAERHVVMQRGMEPSGFPMNMRLLAVRRRTEVKIGSEPPVVSWWWSTRFGRLDSVQFVLASNADGSELARITVVGLDLYVPKWQARGVGLLDLFVPQEHRSQGYAQTLITELCKRLRDELVTLVEAHAPEADQPAIRLLHSTGFRQVDTGVVYRRDAV